jgi:hypothetical protein
MSQHRRIVRLVLPSLLALVTCLVGSCQQPAATGAKCEAEIAADGLNQDIQLLLTMNRLDFKAEQLTSLQAVIAKMGQEMAQAETQRLAALAQVIPLLQEKRAVLLADKQPDNELEGKIREAQGKVEDATNGLVEARAKYAADFKKILSPAQAAIVTGADEANAQAEELLNWIRELPDAEYAEEGKSNAQELADADVGLPADAILKVFAEARKLSKADYDKNKAGLVGQLAKLYMPMPEAADESLAEWFGNPRLADLLRERLAKMGGQ